MSQTRTEERQRLLEVSEQPEDSGDELPTVPQPQDTQETSTVLDPPPSYMPATLTPTPVQSVASNGVAPEMIVPTSTTPIQMISEPPKYSLYAPPSHQVAQSAGYPIEAQVDGRIVPAMIVQDPTGKHMVYIRETQDGADGERPKKPNDYFGLAILGILACCLPFGIIALFKSLEVQRRYRQGDYVGAAAASKQAYSWGTSAVVFGITTVVVVFVMRLYFYNSHSYRHYY